MPVIGYKENKDDDDDDDDNDNPITNTNRFNEFRKNHSFIMRIILKLQYTLWGQNAEVCMFK